MQDAETENKSPAGRLSSYLLDRFGIVLPKEVALEGEKSLRVMNRELADFNTSTPRGIPASRMKGKFPKPSTAFIQVFGNLATKNTLSVSWEDALAYLRGEGLSAQEEKDSSASPSTLETGYIILKYKKAILGIGFYKEGKIANMLPKGRRIRKK
jgi:NOL1/NOP2/fmu family ribosome biogenesis protein